MDNNKEDDNAKECERRVVERTARLHDIELFKQPPKEDCPICFLRMPSLATGSMYMRCCGKVVCSGCYHAPLYDDKGNEVDNEKCSFCRTQWPDLEEEVQMSKKRIDAGDAEAMHNIGCDIYYGANGHPQDYTKALELWHRAAELGNVEAYSNIGASYQQGRGVEVDKKKARHYYDWLCI